MRIVIDMQGAQSKSRFRGIGRHSMSLALAFARNAGEDEIYLALNAAFPESILDIRDAFKDLIPQKHIHVFEVPLPTAEQHSENGTRARVAELIREYFLIQLNPDAVFIPSLFEGYVDSAVITIKKFAKVNTVVALHDLIPLIHSDIYLPEKSQKDYYMRKIESLKKADLLLAVSDSSKQEAVKMLHIDESKIIVISNSVDASFYPLELSNVEIEALHKKYAITRKLVMYAPGGFDVRKNFEGLIKAYSLLPKNIRKEHQLAIVSNIQDWEKRDLIHMAKKVKLSDDELVLTGYVSDEDLIALYCTATLFVFPSKHEGFGLPVLEAMSCGAPVIGSSATSIPEVIGLKEALFDPESPEEMAEKIKQALTDEGFREMLIKHGKQQKDHFSWDRSAQKALLAITEQIKSKNNDNIIKPSFAKKRTLAYFSPLPPVKSGISDYSIEFLPFLSHYYDITLIVEQSEINKSSVEKSFPIHSSEWFLAHANEFDRILYQFGNSPYHSYMRPVLKQHAGVVVMHDFFMSGMLSYEELIEGKQNEWRDALFYSHGYWALKEFYGKNSIEVCKVKYPCNLELLENAKGVITHSQHAKDLAEEWYGNLNLPWNIIPLMRTAPSDTASRESAKKALGFSPNDFIVCSFGFTDVTKLNHRLIDAWNASKLAQYPHAKLIFVGKNTQEEYGYELLTKIDNSPLDKNIIITGWIDADQYKLYLKAADIGVQLRAESRGETSAAVLDCMNYGVATIVNSHGSMSSLADEAVCKLADHFKESDLMEALERLYDEEAYRSKLARHAKETIAREHDPAQCAKQYMKAIEETYMVNPRSVSDLITSVVQIQKDCDPLTLSRSIANSTLSHVGEKQLFIDLSAIVKTDLKTGIERVVRSQLLQLIKSPPQGFRVEPVYLSPEAGWCYKYARKYTCDLLNIKSELADEQIDVANGDIFYGLDYYPQGVIDAANSGLYRQMKAVGVEIVFSIYDILPVTHPEFFPKGSNEVHAQWLKSVVTLSDKLICISHAVADDLRRWSEANLDQSVHSPKITALHLGADIKASSPSKGIERDAKKILDRAAATETFLMVGTIEPRKGHLQTINAFEKLWEEGRDTVLIIVGKEGWIGLGESQRRTIPEIITKIKSHPELNKRLFWLEGISDEYLEKVYKASTCLIAASEGEGFGLPLIEAAQNNMPIVAREIPVFREVAGEYAYYFEDSKDPKVITDALKCWLQLYKENAHPKSDTMPWLTWEENTRQLLELLCIATDANLLPKNNTAIPKGE